MTIHFFVYQSWVFGVISKQYPLVDNFSNSRYLSARQCIRIARRIYIVYWSLLGVKGLIHVLIAWFSKWSNVAHPNKWPLNYEQSLFHSLAHWANKENEKSTLTKTGDKKACAFHPQFSQGADFSILLTVFFVTCSMDKAGKEVIFVA